MRTTGFGLDVEMLMMARLCGFRIADVRRWRLRGEYAAPHLSPLVPAESWRPVRPAP